MTFFKNYNNNDSNQTSIVGIFAMTRHFFHGLRLNSICAIILYTI